MASAWTTHPDHKGVQETHSVGCPKRDGGARCRKDKGCVPRFRKKVGPKGAQRWISSAVLSEVLGATADTAKATEARAGHGRTLEDVGLEWWIMFTGGRIPKRRGAGAPSVTTINGYRPLLFKLPRGMTEPTKAPLDPEIRGLIFREFGHRPGDTITELELQTWVDKLRTQDGRLLSRSRITEILAVVRSIYAYALRSTRAIWTCPDPTANLQIPPAGEERVLRVAQVSEARELLAVLPPDVALPYAIAFGTGLRRSEIARADWRDVMWESHKIHVGKSKSVAGQHRTANVSKLAIQYLKAEFARQGFPAEGLIVQRSVFSGKLIDAADNAWAAANEKRAANRQPSLARISLQECRHTYASMLMAADYKLVEIMANMGQSNLAATQRYLKKLPQPNQVTEADRLHNYEDGFGDSAQAV